MNDGVDILRLLGIDPDGVIAVNLRLRAGEIPTATVRTLVRPTRVEGGDLVTTTQRYELVAVEGE